MPHGELVRGVMDSTKTDSKWEKEFEEKFGEPPMDRFGKFNWRMSDLKTFIATTTKQAVEKNDKKWVSRIKKCMKEYVEVIDDLVDYSGDIPVEEVKEIERMVITNISSTLLTKGDK